MDEWTEPDGTVYRLKENGDYEVIPPKKREERKEECEEKCQY